jgi:Fic-DOC domain mobile mystery protein B
MGLILNHIDGQTPLDEDEKHGLKIKTITTQQALDQFEQLNIESAVEWTIHLNLTPEKILSEKFIKDLHKRMFGKVWNWAGEFRKTNKNIGVNWNLIGVELKKLLDDTHFWIENNIFPEEEIAIRFKHRIVSIHCFSNGNGRHSRLMADIIIESIFKKEIFKWQQSNMTKADDIRKTYISALKEADNGNIELLINFATS